MRSSLAWLTRVACVTIVAALLGGCSLLGVPPQPHDVQITLAPTVPAPSEVMEDAVTVIGKRLQAAGIDSIVTLPEPDKIGIQVDSQEAEQAQRLATTPGRLELVPVPDEFNVEVIDGQPLPADMESEPILTNQDFASATLSTEPTTGQPAVDFTLTP